MSVFLFETVEGADKSYLPEVATGDSAGYDLKARIDDKFIVLKPHRTLIVPTGVRAKFPVDTFLGIFTRSGMAAKHSVIVLNAPGVIDSDYYPNEINVILHNLSNEPYTILRKERIAQAILIGIPQKAYKDSYINRSQKRDGGLGSTGK